MAVQAAEKTPIALMAALEAGRFYASSGVELDDVVVAPRRLEIHIAARGDFRHTTTFIGARGRVLATTGDSPAVYVPDGTETYVRARVTDSMGYHAWTQPVFLTGG